MVTMYERPEGYTDTEWQNWLDSIEEDAGHSSENPDEEVNEDFKGQQQAPPRTQKEVWGDIAKEAQQKEEEQVKVTSLEEALKAQKEEEVKAAGFETQRQSYRAKLGELEWKNAMGRERQASIDRGVKRYGQAKGIAKDIKGLIQNIRTPVDKGNLKLYASENLQHAGRSYQGLRETVKPPTEQVKSYQNMYAGNMKSYVKPIQGLREVNVPERKGDYGQAQGTMRSYVEPGQPERLGLNVIRSTTTIPMGQLRASTRLGSVNPKMAQMVMPKSTSRPLSLEHLKNARSGIGLPKPEMHSLRLGGRQQQQGPTMGMQQVSPIAQLARGSSQQSNIGSLVRNSFRPQVQSQGITIKEEKAPERLANQPKRIMQSKLPAPTEMKLRLPKVKSFNPSYYNRAMKKYRREVGKK